MLPLLLLLFCTEITADDLKITYLNRTEIFYAESATLANQTYGFVSNSTMPPGTKDNVTASAHRKQTFLNICFLWETDSYYSPYSRVVPFVDLGIDQGNKLLKKYNIQLRKFYQNTGPSCTSGQQIAIRNFYNLQNSGVKCQIMIGMSCPHSVTALYGFAHYLNIPLLAIPGAGATSVQPDGSSSFFPLFVQPTWSSTDLCTFIIRFLAVFNLTQITVIQDDSYNFYVNLVTSFSKTVKNLNYPIYASMIIEPVKALQTDQDMYTKILKAHTERSRVMLIFGHATCVRNIMLAAAELGYTKGEHIYITVELFGLKDYWGTNDPVVGDESDLVAIPAFESLLVIQLMDDTIPGPLEDQFALAATRFARERYNYTFGPLEKIDVILKNHYESIVIYAMIVDNLISHGKNHLDGKLVTTKMFMTEYADPLGGMFYFGDARQKEKGYIVKHYDSEDERYETVLVCPPHSSFSLERRNKFNWPGTHGDRLPPNEPKCGYRGEKCIINVSSTTLGFIVAIALIFGLIMAAVGSFIGYRLWKARKEANPLWWRIHLHEIDVKAHKSLALSRRSMRSSVTLGTLAESAIYSAQMIGLFGLYNGNVVGLVDVATRRLMPAKELVDQLQTIKKLSHGNLQKLIGIALDDSNMCIYIVGEICSKGSLTSVIENPVLKLDWFFKNLIVRDMVSGMEYLHSTPITSHGNLTSNTCQLDNRFTLKISDYGLPYFRRKMDLMPPDPADYERDWEELLWRAPELLRQQTPPNGTPRGDVYSFAIILQQIILRSLPYETPEDYNAESRSSRQIVVDVMEGSQPLERPRVPRSACSNELYDLMERCWEETPLNRPTFAKVKDRLQKIFGDIGDNVIDSLFKRMEQYAADLEKKVAEQTAAFVDEKQRTDNLLGEILPKTVAAALTKGLTVGPEAFDSVTIYFSDVPDFPILSSQGDPFDVIDLLNNLYDFMDRILLRYDVYKVETVQDAFLVSSGLPMRNGNKHVMEICAMALDVMSGVQAFPVPHLPDASVKVRIGINSGPCVTGIVGKKMPRYCLFGDTVNTASRMESTGEVGKIQFSPETKRLLDGAGGFKYTVRGEIPVKGKGLMMTYWLNGKTA